MARGSIDGRTRRPRYTGCQCTGGPKGIVRAVTEKTPNKEPVCVACGRLVQTAIEGAGGPAVILTAADRMEKRMGHMKGWKPDPTLRERRRGASPLL